MLNTSLSLSLCQPTLLCSNHHYSHLTPGNQLSPATHPALIETQSYQWLFINDRTLRHAAEGDFELNSELYTFLTAAINLNHKCDDWTIFAVLVKMFAFAAGLIRTDRFCLYHWAPSQHWGGSQSNSAALKIYMCRVYRTCVWSKWRWMILTYQSTKTHTLPKR